MTCFLIFNGWISLPANPILYYILLPLSPHINTKIGKPQVERQKRNKTKWMLGLKATDLKISWCLFACVGVTVCWDTRCYIINTNLMKADSGVTYSDLTWIVYNSRAQTPAEVSQSRESRLSVREAEPNNIKHPGQAFIVRTHNWEHRNSSSAISPSNKCEIKRSEQNGESNKSFSSFVRYCSRQGRKTRDTEKIYFKKKIF